MRRLLARDGDPNPIVTRRGGYGIRIDLNTLDARRFKVRVAEARATALAGGMAETAMLFQEALDLWRGPALSGLRGKLIETAASVWNERRWDAQEQYFDTRIALGEHSQIIGDLLALVSAHPMRERPVGQLMLALYRCGRKAEALALYRDTHRLLAHELGLEPGAELQRLHQQILADGQELQLPDMQGREKLAAHRVRANPQGIALGLAAVPRQLPAAPRNFAGRWAELAALSKLLDEGGRRATRF